MKILRWDGNPISAPGIYSGVPMERYHSADLCVGPSISSSGLRTIFDPKRGPMAFWIESALNPNRIEPEEKDAFILGRATHHLALGEDRFSRYYTVEPETYPDEKTGQPKKWNNNANFCRAWQEHVAAEGLTVLTRKQVEAIRGMAGLLPWQEGLEDSGLRNSAVVRAGALSGLVEHTIIAKDEETGVYLKARPDAIPLDSTEFNDLKTTQSVDGISISRTLDDLRYDMQAVVASICLEQAAGHPFTSFGFIFVMKKPPHAVEIVELTEVDLNDAALDVRTSLRTFARCLDSGRWPGPGGGRADARHIQRSERSRNDAMGRRSILEMELAQ